MSTPPEKWRPVARHPTFAVSNHGRVRNLRGYILTPFNGSITIRYIKTPHCLRVARLVGEAFNAGFAKNLVPIYRNGDRSDCRPCNLKWVPRSVIAGSPYSVNPKQPK